MEREAKKEQKILDFEEKKRKIEEVEENKRKKRKEQRQRRRNNGDKKKVNLEKLAEPETSNQFKMVPNTFALSEQGDDLNIKSLISDSDAEPLVSSTHNKDTNPLHGTNISSDENSAKTSSRHRTFTNIIDE
ncbi:hypothetical protein AX774_g1712 [Zancudomyces culisetae]|uniref:Uncharacterized protein n=1 Tax=Zancudomyces culisetae TaxID=1213189 RepID=A0A1R1PQV9_ZANCU|nr:hypothetical protein AX774_g3118 [Zancudomyces culisetae]OMH84748.1 hypothetical protein AX774_g1712 [Zancudomyces culisetae]|eukprot:OMH83375.1 hypothetical protein AX774_g3118 [Zancudomyces culisetae]